MAHILVLAALALSLPYLRPSGWAAAGTRSTQALTVVRDSSGIPHIRAANFRLLGYGEAYVFAQDNFCALADDFVTVNGLRSLYFGQNATVDQYTTNAPSRNIDSDIYWKYIKASKVVEEQLGSPPPVGPLPQIRDLYRGFVTGYNTYLKSGKLTDPNCAGKPWVRPITLTDMWLRAEQIMTVGSGQNFIDSLAAAAPPATTGSLPETERSAASPQAITSPAMGSNGIATGRDDTVAHDGMVLANPHFPWRGPNRFWLVHLTVPGQYDVMGGTLFGFPLVGIGFNHDVAWTHTISTDQRFTLYRIPLAAGEPRSYLIDGRPSTMRRFDLSIRVKGGKSVSHTVYTTRWGPVIDNAQLGYRWGSDFAYALRDSTVSNDAVRTANQYLRMGQSTSVGRLLDTEEKFLAIPLFNTIAADSGGRTLYADVGNTPGVDDSMIADCVPSGLPEQVLKGTGIITLDGGRSSCDWKTSVGTPVKGILSGSQEPHLMRTDHVENSNDSYWLANPDHPLTGFPSVIGATDVEQNSRTRLGNRMIQQRLDGSDGLGPAGFSLSAMERMWTQYRSGFAESALESLTKACKTDPVATSSDGTAVDLTSACVVLTHYRMTGTLTDPGGWLFSEWYSFFEQDPGADIWLDGFDPSRPLTTPRNMNTTNPKLREALADAVLALKVHKTDLAATYGDVQYALRGTERIPVPGCSTGCFATVDSGQDPSDPNSPRTVPYGQADYGNSLVMATELTHSGPVSEGMLTYSQATNTNSPWYDNLTRDYSQSRWVPLRYSSSQLREDKNAQAVGLPPYIADASSP